MAEPEIMVVGAGVGGPSIAAGLTAAAKVALIEAEDAACYQITGRSAAMFLASYGNGAIRMLTYASRALFRSPPAGFADHALLRRRGLWTFADLDHRADLIGATCDGPQEFPVDEALAIRPALRGEAFVGQCGFGIPSAPATAALTA